MEHSLPAHIAQRHVSQVRGFHVILHPGLLCKFLLTHNARINYFFLRCGRRYSMAKNTRIAISELVGPIQQGQVLVIHGGSFPLDLEGV